MKITQTTNSSAKQTNNINENNTNFLFTSCNSDDVYTLKTSAKHTNNINENNTNNKIQNT